MKKRKKYDLTVIGSGIAGLSVATRFAEIGYRVAIITKKDSTESNTNYAQGGIASVTSSSDGIDMHIKDTINAGDGLCDEKVVKKILRDGPKCIANLKEKGVSFSSLSDGRISLGKEGGHSKRRILHVKDRTGKAIEEALIDAAKNNGFIDIYEHHYAVDLITNNKVIKDQFNKLNDSNKVCGVFVLDVSSGIVVALKSKSVLIATGGIGQIYQFTTNPTIATGDGIAMAYRAGAEINDMEFIQFHPTTFYSNKNNERFLISEALRGEGAVLRNLLGDPFMKNYDIRGDLAPRDIVARAIDYEMKKTGALHLWLDATKIDKKTLKTRFPNIFDYCLKKNIEIDKKWIPIIPAAHYLCGGIKANLNGETNIKGLYACGEAACTGLHGANRLASNSLLEAIVMALRSIKSLDLYVSKFENISIKRINWLDGDLNISDEKVVLTHNKEELQRTMWDYVSIVRTDKRLKRALRRLLNLEEEINEYYWNFKVDVNLLELRNMITVSKLIVQCAIMRKESRGLHYNLDYSNRLELAKHSSLIKEK